MTPAPIARRGLLAAGNWIIDHVKTLDAWPEQDGLVNILAHETGNGGGPYNVLKDLARLRAPFPLAGLGLVGDDDDGRAILADCAAHGIDTARLQITSAAPTSYTDVMTVRGTAVAHFSTTAVPMRNSPPRISISPESPLVGSTSVTYCCWTRLMRRLQKS
jgi:sugar/nucleoside kinase (ribokinase family)